MTGSVLMPRALTREAFAPFGDVIDTRDAERFEINAGTTTRYHDLARVETAGPGARTLLNLFRARPFSLPLEIAAMERHPLGSQAFIALDDQPWLVVVAPDVDGAPGEPVAFLIAGGAPLGVNYGRNVWHHPLLALRATFDFLVIDRGGEGVNLQEAAYDHPFRIERLP